MSGMHIDKWIRLFGDATAGAVNVRMNGINLREHSGYLSSRGQTWT